MITLPEGYNFSADIGYIVIPTDIDRNQYVTNCLRTSTVSVTTNDGAFYNRIPLSYLDMSFADFPDKPGKYGSTVLLINHPTSNHFIGACIFKGPQDIQDLQENQFKFKRDWKENHVEISGSGKDKYVGVSIDSNSSGGYFYVKVNNKTNDAKIELQVSGDIETQSNNTKQLNFNSHEITTISSDNEEELATIKQTVDKNYLLAKLNHLEGDKIQHNKGSEPMLLGATTTKKFVKILEAIMKLSVPTALGPSGLPINTPEFQAILKEIDEIKSELSFLD